MALVIGGGGLDRLRPKQRQRPWPPGILVKDFDRLAPSLGLRGIDLAQIQDLALQHPAIAEALALDDVPVGMRLAVLLSLGSPQEHDGGSLCTQGRPWKWGRSSLQPISAVLEIHYPAKSETWPHATGPKSAFSSANPRSRASTPDTPSGGPQPPPGAAIVTLDSDPESFGLSARQLRRN